VFVILASEIIPALFLDSGTWIEFIIGIRIRKDNIDVEKAADILIF